jgi:hypothetical protein
MKSWLTNLFYRSFLGGLYMEVLLFLDRRSDKQRRHLTPGEVSQIIREHSLLYEGVKVVKRNINSLVTKEKNLNRVLTEAGDLTLQATDNTSSKAQVINSIRSSLDFSNKDIKNDTDYAKMLDKRIRDYDELHSHINKRNALREARKQKNGK